MTARVSPSGRRRVSWVVVTTALLLPSAVGAQTGVVVEGRVMEVGGPGIEGAIVELEGLRPLMTGFGGEFRLERVRPGMRWVRVTAFGYASLRDTVLVTPGTPLVLSLEAVPFRLDSLVVAPRKVDLEGRVRDESRDLSLAHADVLTSQRHAIRTNLVGRFDLEVWDGTPIQILVRAFGYLPADTVVVPSGDERVDFHLEEDELVSRMIGVELTRLDGRAGGLMATTMRPLNRGDLLRLRHSTLREVIRARFPARYRRVRCVVLDEEALTPGMAAGVLQTTLASEVERIEFLFRGAMLRVYTRDFMRRMLGGGIELRRPTYVDMADPPFCG